jgi:pimeloyl-ACP methyl ester carboxylesterase
MLLLASALLCAQLDDTPPVTRLAFASCANERVHPGLASFVAAAQWRPHAAALLGDTPYIDSTEPQVLAERHRAFRDHPAMELLRRQCTVYAVWDDHDFGLNNTDGNLPGKQAARTAFVAAHPEQDCGDGVGGVWTTFRRGGIEVWLLDARWNANTEVDGLGRPGLLGEAQWRWLEAGLAKSDADFKILGSGMVFNDAVRPGKTDYWGAWPHERQRLFRMLGARGIRGVVLVSGDIHRSRLVRHDTRDIVGYALTELVTSPAAQKVGAKADAPHADLVWDRGMEQTWMSIEASGQGDAALLVADFRDETGVSYFQTRLWAKHLRGEPRMQTGFVYHESKFGDATWKWAAHVPRDWRPGGPALLFLHGRGECGVDGQLQLAVGLPPALLRAPAEWPFLVVCPQKPSPDEDWEHYEREVLGILDAALDRHGADPLRVAVTGLSQGGHGAWELARRHPARFRAVVPLCGYPAAPARGWRDFDARRDFGLEHQSPAAGPIADALRGVPVWAVHGEADAAVPASLTTVVVEALSARGAAPRLTLYQGVGHDCWTRAYADPELARFLRESCAPR